MPTPPRSPHFLISLLMPLSIISMLGGLIIGLGLIVSEFFSSTSGFLPGLGYFLGLMALGAGILLSFLLNALCWTLHYRPRWLKYLLAVQVLPALVAAGYGAKEWWDQAQEKRAYAQIEAMHNSIRRDDVSALQTAQNQCGARCRKDSYGSLEHNLLVASESGAQAAARYLVAQGVRIPGTMRGAMRRTMDLRSCEGLYLHAIDALGLAVARNDPDMVRLLLSVSEPYEHRLALRTAARLDRVEMVDLLLQAGALTADATNRDNPGDTLLADAASGASLRVAERLLAQPPQPLETRHLQAALGNLVEFIDSVRAPQAQKRAEALARLLIAHGADLNAPYQNRSSFLAAALSTQRKTFLQLWLTLGADTGALTPTQRQAMERILQKPDYPYTDTPPEHCIKL